MMVHASIQARISFYLRFIYVTLRIALSDITIGLLLAGDTQDYRIQDSHHRFKHMSKDTISLLFFVSRLLLTGQVPVGQLHVSICFVDSEYYPLAGQGCKIMYVYGILSAAARKKRTPSSCGPAYT